MTHHCGLASLGAWGLTLHSRTLVRGSLTPETLLGFSFLSHHLFCSHFLPKEAGNQHCPQESSWWVGWGRHSEGHGAVSIPNSWDRHTQACSLTPRQWRPWAPSKMGEFIDVISNTVARILASLLVFFFSTHTSFCNQLSLFT